MLSQGAGSAQEGQEGSPAAILLQRRSWEMGWLWAPLSCSGNGRPGNAGVSRQVHRAHLGTSAETLLQWPLKSPPDIPTCVLRQLVGQPKVRETGEVTSCHKKTLQHCRSPHSFLACLLFPSFCRCHPEGRPVTPHLLSLPNPLQLANDGAARQKLALPTSKASSALETLPPLLRRCVLAVH